MNRKNGDVVLITYASKAYEKSGKALKKRAAAIGFCDVRILGPSDLNSEFIERNRETLEFPRGAGYWVWKPSIIDSTLKTIGRNQTLLYCDAGVMLRSSAKYFEELSQDGLIHLWLPQSNRQSNNFWIDKKVWETIVGERDVSKDPHYWAGLILGKNNQEFRRLVGTWLDMCQREDLLRPDSIENYSPSAELIGHRHDQSILNCLVHLDSSRFNLHSFNSDARKSPVIIHRRGNLKSYPQALFVVLIGRIYRWVLKHLPKPIRHLIFKSVSRYRRPYASIDEIERHLELFLF